MLGPDPSIRAAPSTPASVDGRVKPGHDRGGCARQVGCLPRNRRTRPLAQISRDVYTRRLRDEVGTMPGGWVYIMTNRPNGTLYTGVTSNIARRVWEHREGVVEGFTKQYGLKRLVYAERHEDITAAIQREKTIKHWTRAWKVTLILETNPSWGDLYDLLS
jgi:putative endonuclease